MTQSSFVVHISDVHLDGSSLVFDDIFKLVSFYCVSRYVYKKQFISIYRKSVRNVLGPDTFM